MNLFAAASKVVAPSRYLRAVEQCNAIRSYQIRLMKIFKHRVYGCPHSWFMTASYTTPVLCTLAALCRQRNVRPHGRSTSARRSYKTTACQRCSLSGPRRLRRSLPKVNDAARAANRRPMATSSVHPSHPQLLQLWSFAAATARHV